MGFKISLNNKRIIDLYVKKGKSLKAIGDILIVICALLKEF